MKRWSFRAEKLRALVLVGVFAGAPAQASSIKPETIHSAPGRKTESYIQDGLFVGGDRAVGAVVVRGIRRAANAGFERIVLDLEGTLAGEPMVLQRAPYFQIAVNREERRLVVSIWGNPRLGFDPAQVQKAFRKSAIVARAELLPRLDDESWTFVLTLKRVVPVEVFELRDPVRLIVDLRTDARAAARATRGE